eukprot:g12133.t1
MSWSATIRPHPKTASESPVGFGAPFEVRPPKPKEVKGGRRKSSQASKSPRGDSPREPSSSLMLRSASFSSMEGSLMASTSCKTLRTSRSMGRLSLSNLSLCASESVENERRQTERGLERESRWLKRALSEEMHRIEAMQEPLRVQLERAENQLCLLEFIRSYPLLY